jgi:hypothetical protein
MGSARELLDQEAHGEVDAQRADLVAAKIVDDGVRDADFPARRLDSGELSDVRAGEIGLDGRLAVIDEQVFQLRPGVERDLVDLPDQLPGALSSFGPLVGPLERGDDVLGEVAREVGTLDKCVEVLLHHLSLCTHWRLLLVEAIGRGPMQKLSLVSGMTPDNRPRPQERSQCPLSAPL